jgi:hypothetical protein
VPLKEFGIKHKFGANIIQKYAILVPVAKNK